MGGPNGTVLGRDAIASVSDRGFGEIDVPEWGGTVRLKELSGREVLELGLDAADGKFSAEMMIKVVAASMVDENGSRLFDPDDARDQEIISQKARKPLLDVFMKALEVSKLTEEATSEEGKDSETSPSGDSSTD